MSAEAVWAESMEEQPMGGEEEAARWRDVACQWEEPDEGGGATREVGCQSGAGGGVIMIDVAVQVDLNNTDVSLQCVLVKSQKRKRGRPKKYPSVCPPAPPSLPPSPLDPEGEEGEEEEEEESGGGRGDEGGGGEEVGEEEMRGVEDDGDPTWKPVRLKRHRVIGRKVIGSYRRYIKVEEPAEGEEPGEGEESDGDGGMARKRRRRRRGRRRSNATMEEEEEEPGEQEDQDDAADRKTPGGVVCEVCGKVMSCRTNLARHAITHTGLQPFPCPVCGQRFNRYSNAQSHMRRMHSEADSRPRGRRREHGDNSAPSWLCEMCGKSFNCHSRLRVHVMGHNGVKPYGCHICPKTYVSAADLYKHIRKVHEEGTTVRYSGGPLLCDRCGREFKCRSLLVAHYRTHTGERPFHCDMCTLKFARPHLLRRHKANVHAEGRTRVRSEVTAEEERPFVCQVCGKRLKTVVQLESHVRVHTEDRPHSCSVCLRGFSSSRTLRQHQLTVHAEGAERRTPTRKTASAARKAEKEEPETPSPYVCPTCGRDFKFRSTLALHSVTHTKERPHHCDLCPQRFGLLGHLKRHREDVHPDGKAGPKEARVFSCPICGKTFRKSRLRLERHMTSVHDQPQLWPLTAPADDVPPPSPSSNRKRKERVAAGDNGVGTIIMVTVPGNENQDAPEEEEGEEGEEGEGEEGEEGEEEEESDSGRTDGDTHHAVVSVTPPNDTGTHHDMLAVTPNDVTETHHDMLAVTPNDVTETHHDMLAVTPNDVTETHHDMLAVTPNDVTETHHDMLAVATPLDEPQEHEEAAPPPGGETSDAALDDHHTHHVIAVTTQPEDGGRGRGYAQMIQVTHTDDGSYAQVMAVEAQSEGEAAYAQIIEAQADIVEVTQADIVEVTQADIVEVTQADIVEVTQADIVEVTQADIVEVTQADIVEVTQADIVEVTQADIVEVTQADIVEVTQADIVEVTQADIVEVTQADMMEVTQAGGYDQETIIIEVTQPGSLEAEEVFVPPPT